MRGERYYEERPRWVDELLREFYVLRKEVNDLRKEVAMAIAELDRTIASVEKLESAVDGMVTLLGTLSDLIRQAGEMPDVKAALTKLADEVDAKAQAAADAIAANTPAAPQP